MHQFKDVLRWYIRIALFCTIKFQDSLWFYSSVAHSSLIVLPIFPIKDAWDSRKMSNKDECATKNAQTNRMRYKHRIQDKERNLTECLLLAKVLISEK